MESNREKCIKTSTQKNVKCNETLTTILHKIYCVRAFGASAGTVSMKSARNHYIFLFSKVENNKIRKWHWARASRCDAQLLYRFTIVTTLTIEFESINFIYHD